MSTPFWSIIRRMKQTDPQFKLRIPQDIKDRLEEAAKTNGRSVTQEIIYRLEQSLDDRPAQTEKSSYALSAIERLESMLIATEGQRDSIAQQALPIATALAATYPYARAMMNADPKVKERITATVDLGLKATRAFVSTYKPIGIDSAISTLNNIQRVLGPAFRHLSRDEREMLSVNFGTEANDYIKGLESDSITYIKKVLDQFDVPDLSQEPQGDDHIETDKTRSAARKKLPSE
jgi:predicted DNA-binding protein